MYLPTWRHNLRSELQSRRKSFGPFAGFCGKSYEQYSTDERLYNYSHAYIRII